ncbi:MAG TPA: hypothetical protein VIM50_04635 [Candidatus Limnocylindria bacterium]|jgi:hypothetical protein
MSEHDDIKGWLTGRVPAEWYSGTPEVSVDREEILVVGPLAEVKIDGTAETAAAARDGRVKQHRETTRQARMAIAAEAERRFGRTISWGVRYGDKTELFTHLSIPVMTRLRQPERQILDALVEAGVARSRSHALAWCVRLVGEHTGDWINELREAVAKVHQVRDGGPLN